ncbi:MAG: sulfatase [Calditrichaeota bacterium]|nr:sulfatase [Calditrichota bacterium]
MTLANFNRRQFLKLLGVGAASSALPVWGYSKSDKMPNIIIVFTDDQGYADVGTFGAVGFKTPNLDRMAREGMRFTNFHVAQPVCSASRASLLTGCYCNRIGITGALGPRSKIGISDDEMTLAQLVKQKNYATAIFGKWHLGYQKKFLPTRHGFDEFFGLPYSHDMWPHHPEHPESYPDLPLIEDEKIIAYNPDITKLTTWYTEHAVQFIEKNKNHPFFLYVAHNMPHVPLGVSDKFKGKSKRGLYGDVIMEIDWSVGQIMEAVQRNGLDDNTLIIFTSDNGPWLSYGDHAGSAKPLREGKGTTWDGGQREPCIMRWPGKIPANAVCKEPLMTIDIFPTIAGLIGARLPDHKIDGLDIWPIMSGKKDAKSPHDALYFYWNNDLQAVIRGKWKMHFPHNYRTLNGRPGGTGGMPVKYEQAHTDLVLYNLDKDIGEQHDVSAEHPDIVKRLTKMGKKFDKELKKTKRPPGRV